MTTMTHHQIVVATTREGNVSRAPFRSVVTTARGLRQVVSRHQRGLPSGEYAEAWLLAESATWLGVRPGEVGEPRCRVVAPVLLLTLGASA